MSKLKIRPLGDRLVVEPIEQEARRESGLYIPETAKEKPQQGLVLAVGPGAYREDGAERIPMEVKEGDTVLFGKYAGTDIKLGDKELKILKESDVLAIIQKE